MRTPQPLLPLATFALIASTCTRPHEDVALARSALDFPTGALQGTVSWNGTAVSGPAAAAVLVHLGPSTGIFLSANGTYSFPAIAPGNYDVSAYANGCANNDPSKLGGTTATVVAGTTTTADFDLTATAGRVVGRLTVNGAPLLQSRLEFNTGCAARTAPTDGSFALYFPPGNHVAVVYGPVSQIGLLTFTITAGQQTDLGTIDLPVGALTGTVSWNGAPVTGLGASANVVHLGGSTGVLLSPEGTYLFQAISPGNYDVGVYANGCAGTGVLGSKPTTVFAGTTTTVDVDLTPTAGRLVARLTANGVPLPRPRLEFTDSTCPATAVGNSDENGNLVDYLSPKTYSVDVIADSGRVGSLTFTIVAGQQTDLGTVDFPSGTLRGTVSWNGAPVSGLGVVSTFVHLVGATGHFLNADGSYSFAGVAVGTYDLSVYANGCAGRDAARLAVKPATVVGGATTTTDIDMTPTAGRLVGHVTVNGAPLPKPRLEFSNICSGDPAATSDTAGNFAEYLAPGEYSVDVSGSSGRVGSLTFAITAGQTTSVDTITTPACSAVTTPPCSEIPTTLNGGLTQVNGLELTFSTVTTGGDTKVVASGSCVPTCNPPPDGFTVVGNRYWDLHTDAVHTGPITVCIHYDATKLMGDEDDLRLMHDDNDGAGWHGITTSLCKSDGCAAKSDPCETCTTPAIICGVATSFSPFAIMEPVRAPDTTPPAFAGVPGMVIAYATSTGGAVVSYDAPTAVDDVDGPTSVSCTPASGSQFPPGQTTVTCTTADISGNPNAVSFIVWVQYQAPADGSFFLKPIRADSSSVFRIGRPVPVKFRLTGASQNITDLQARLVVSKISDQIRGTADDESDEDGDETDFLFKYRKAKGIYAYRWKTCDQTRGTYRLRAELGDGVVHEINVSLKARR